MRTPKLIFLAVICCMALPLAAQDLNPPNSATRPQSLQDLRNTIAWYGAYCVMNAVEIEQYGHIASLSSIAEDTGVPLEAIAAVAAARAAEYAISVAVLHAGGEPLRDPPEPFLSMLQQTQADCQEYERSRNVLEAAIARGNLPDTAPASAPGPLRASLDPLPFDRDRAVRMGYVLAAVDDIRAAGMFEAETLALAQAISGHTDLTLDYISGITDPQERRWIAAELLLPSPTGTTDLTAQEAAELLARVDADPDGDFARYYVSLLAANLEALGEEAVLNGADGAAVLFLQTGPLVDECRRLASSAAMRCDPVTRD